MLDLTGGRPEPTLLFMQDENQAVLRLEPEPLSYWICTTDGAEKSKIESMREKSPELALIDILTKLSKGDHY